MLQQSDLHQQRSVCMKYFLFWFKMRKELKSLVVRRRFAKIFPKKPLGSSKTWNKFEHNPHYRIYFKSFADDIGQSISMASVAKTLKRIKLQLLADNSKT